MSQAAARNGMRARTDPSAVQGSHVSYSIIVHASPPSDGSFTHWTEAPECPAAHEGGRSADEAVSRTMAGIRSWHARHRLGGADAIEFRVEDAR